LSISETVKALKETGDDFEIGILLTESLSSALAFRLAGVTNIYGYTANARSLLFKSPATHDSKKIHRSESYIRLVRHATMKFWANPYWVEDVVFGSPDIYLRDSETVAARGILKRHDIDENIPFVAIAPRAVAESRRWGVDNYAELSRKIITKLDIKVVLIGSADDREFAEMVCESVGDGAINFCNRFKIRGTAAILTLAGAFVGNDSGLAHLAALASVPAVVISGPDDPEVTSPLSARKIVLRRAELECISCVKNICPLKGEKRMLCMRKIAVDDVFGALQSLLK
ncbi:MAG: glycosyltransferase family 9 protein, partial [candidate division Zixibacteria bacterium]|nr:glycosyltransferase family 9 protein [candidate division Zixibacteria bacterium]